MNPHAMAAMDRKRQRRPGAGNMVVSAFFGGGARSQAPHHSHPSTPSSTTTTPKSNGGTLTTTSTTSTTTTAPAPKKKQSTAQPRPTLVVPPRGIGPVHTPNRNDVLSGRGGRINAHAGNVQFRHVVQSKKDAYLDKATKKLDKAHIAAEIVGAIRKLEPSGRFLKEDADGAWWDIGDQKAIKKVGQALREDAPDIRVEDGTGTGSGDAGEGAIDGGAGSGGTDTKAKSSPAVKERKATKKSSSAKGSAVLGGCSSTETTPRQGRHRVTPLPVGSMPVAPILTSASSSSSSKMATAVSGRGGKTSSSPSMRSQQQQQQQQQPLSFAEIDLPSAPHNSNHNHHHHHPNHQYQTVVPPASLRGSQQPQFYGNVRASGAAAAAMHEDNHEIAFDLPLEVVPPPPPPSHGQEAFGRTFYLPPDDRPGESSLISGLSGPHSVLSGTASSAISGLTDPMSSVSGTAGHTHNTALLRTQRLDQTRQNWQPTRVSQQQMQQPPPPNVTAPMLQRLTAGTAGGPLMDDGMSWTEHSLQDGGLLRAVGGGGRGDNNNNNNMVSHYTSPGNEASLPQYEAYDTVDTFAPLPVAEPSSSSMHQNNHTMLLPMHPPPRGVRSRGVQSHPYPQQPQPQHQYEQHHPEQPQQQQLHYHPPQNNHHHPSGAARAYYPPPTCDQSVTSMSLASHADSISMPGSILSNLSDNMSALDLAGNSSSGRSLLDI